MSAPQPVNPADRLAAIDALRGIALCGILLINIFDMGGPLAMDRPMTMPALADPDWQVWTIAQLFIAGTMRGLFSLLFGVGLLIFLGGGDEAGRPRLLVRRLVLLLLFGIVDSTLLLWPGDILIIYALAGLLLMIVPPLRPAQMIAVAAILLLVISIGAGIEASTITPEQTVYSPEMLAREGAARLGGYGQSFDYMSYVSWNWTFNPLTFRWIGDAASFMLVGMALHRRGLFAASADSGLLRRMMWSGYAIGFIVRAIHTGLVWHNDGAPTVVSALIDQPGRLAMTLGHAGLFLLLWRRAGFASRMRRLTDMGRMALTLYLGQSLLAAILFSGFGFGLWNSLSWPMLWLLALAILVVEALFAALWFTRFRYGPVEWLWRWGTYRRRP